MRKSLRTQMAGLLVAGSVLASAGAAQAGPFTFSFQNVTGSASGTVTGTITLPDGNGTFSALSVMIDSGPAGLGFSFPTSGMTLGTVSNSFTVAAGQIVQSSVDFTGLITPGTALGLHTSLVGGSTFLDALDSASVGAIGVQDVTSSTLTFTAINNVPEPGCIALLTVGMAGLTGVTRRGRSARR